MKWGLAPHIMTKRLQDLGYTFRGLRDHARIRLQLRLDRVIPLGKSFMVLQSK
jgi:hypothetical protein